MICVAMGSRREVSTRIFEGGLEVKTVEHALISLIRPSENGALIKP